MPSRRVCQEHCSMPQYQWVHLWFYLYQLPPTPYLRQSKLTGYGVWTLLISFLLLRREGESFMGDSLSSVYLMLGHVAQSNWLRLWTRVSLLLPCLLSLIYTSPFSSFFSILLVLIVKEKEIFTLVLCFSWNRHLPGIRQLGKSPLLLLLSVLYVSGKAANLGF